MRPAPRVAQELSIDEAMEVAVELHRRGDLDRAGRLYSRVLNMCPDQSDALHFLGILLHQRGRPEEAIACMERASALGPMTADRCNNLGNVLLELGRHEAAAHAYRQAIALDARHADAYNNLGAVLRRQGRLDDAHDAYLRAIALHPAHVDAHNNLGNLYARRGDTARAVACYCTALTLAPGQPQSRKYLGMAYASLGQPARAADVFRRWMEDEPGSPVARHLYAACSGIDVPARAPDAYIEATFDDFAASFDAKLGALDYRAPEFVAAALALACAGQARRLSVLDAGCGTGLCGPLIEPHASHIVGVDLSSGMLQRARARGVYDELIKAELQAFLSSRPASFDAVISADTLVYFGALAGVFEAACSALHPGGVLIITLEAAPDGGEDYRINPHGRYSHSRAYVLRAMERAGLLPEACEARVLRTESGKPVEGMVVTGRKPAGAAIRTTPHRGACAGGVTGASDA